MMHLVDIWFSELKSSCSLTFFVFLLFISAQTSFSSFSILGEDVTAASDGSMDVAIADASDVGTYWHADFL